MRTGRPKVELVLSDEETVAASVLCSQSFASGSAEQSGSKGEPNNTIADRLRLTKATVGK